MSCNKLALNSKNQQVSILMSDEQFELWFLEKHDMSMFDDESVRLLLEEEKPAVYPCIPAISNDGFTITYVELNLVERWFNKLYGSQDKDRVSFC